MLRASRSFGPNKCVHGAQEVFPGPGSNFCAAAKVATPGGEVYCVVRMETQPAQMAYKLTVRHRHSSTTLLCSAVVVVVILIIMSSFYYP